MSKRCWHRSDDPAPMEYWLSERPGGRTDYVYIRRNAHANWSIVEYKDGLSRDGFKVLAGPFPTLKVAKVAWLMMFPVGEAA